VPAIFGLTLTQLHVRLGVWTLVGLGLLALWAGIVHLRRARLGRGYWQVMNIIHGLLALQVLAATSVYLMGFRARVGLHYWYAIFALVAVVVQRAYMPGGTLRRAYAGGQFREAYFFFLATLVAFLLLGRAYMTGLLGR